MEKDEKLHSIGPTTISRRDFLAGSVASLAAVAVGRSVLSSQPLNHDLSDEVFDRAKQRATDMVSRMTLEEVTGQLVNNVPALPKLGMARYNYWTEALHGIAVDGPITSFPQPIALGCSWNPDLVDKVYSAVSDEARAYHNKTGRGLAFFSPATVNMGLRDPRWGRAVENFSEDPLLVQTFGVRVTRAMQGNHPQYLKTIACAKHFACNDTDTDRDYADAAPDRRSFWEYYMPGFEACVREGRVFSVMSAYNSLWGIPCSASPFLLTDTLRKRWGFKGYVVSDCDAIRDIYQTHHYVETPEEAAAVAIKAGSDLNCGRTYSQSLKKAVEEKLVSEEAIRNALVRVLTGRVLLGEFDAPGAVPWDGLTAEVLEGKKHRELAREAARQSIVLLKNEGGLLPLDKHAMKRIAVIGPLASACHLGNYSGRATYLVSPYAGISAALGESLFTGKIMAGQYVNASYFPGPMAAYSHDGTEYLANIRNNTWTQYGPIDFTGKAAIEFQYAAGIAGGIDVYLDDFNHAPLVSMETAVSPGMSDWQTISKPIPAITGSHFVILKFRGSVDRRPFMNLASFQLAPAQAAPESVPRVVFAPGCAIVGPRNQALLDAAVKAAAGADAAILFLGVNGLLSDEGRDRDSLDLPDVQHELADAVLAANPRTVLVIHTTCPVAFEAESEKARAILCSLFAGEQQGHAIADAIFGDSNPGGKLCSTWYRSADQLPNFHDYDIKHGRTYMYFKGEPLYPFGHGLSYSSFAYKNLRLDADHLAPGRTIHLTADITNTSHVAGDEVVQLYVKAAGKVERPNLQLADFRREPLQPGETRTVTLSLPHDHVALRYWNEAKDQFDYEAGEIQLLVGSSSADIRLRGQVMLV